MTVRAVDMFAGWGGFSLAIEQAGVKLVFAANHWPLACAAHKLNHPEILATETEMCQDLSQYNWNLLTNPPFADFELLTASPACQGFSTAGRVRQRRYHDDLRSTMWAPLDCLDVTQPKAFIVENVESVRQWPLYTIWLQALSYLGYAVHQYELCASYHGVPQARERLFIVGVRRKVKDWPEFDSRSTAPYEEPFGPYLLADDDPRVVDKWKDWTAPRAVGAGSVLRINESRERIAALGLDPASTPFMVQDVTGHKGRTLDQPLATVTCQDHWSLVDGDYYRRFHVREYARAMGFPEDYQWPAVTSKAANVKGLGNAVCPPVAKMLIEQVVDMM
jgi:DNA (cytosine-5)-methyltransferase 1